MKRKTVLASGLLSAVLVAGGVWLAIAAAPETAGATAQSTSDLGLAGPLGPQAFSAIPSYFKQVTFSRSQLGQFQYIDAHLPAGRYLVQVQAVNPPAGGSPDCAGVAFPLVPSSTDRTSFRGYVSVVSAGEVATVSCYERGSGPNATATFNLFYLPVASAG
jgi:hypothetical protein